MCGTRLVRSGVLSTFGMPPGSPQSSCSDKTALRSTVRRRLRHLGRCKQRAALLHMVDALLPALLADIELHLPSHRHRRDALLAAQANACIDTASGRARNRQGDPPPPTRAAARDAQWWHTQSRWRPAPALARPACRSRHTRPPGGVRATFATTLCSSDRPSRPRTSPPPARQGQFGGP